MSPKTGCVIALFILLLPGVWVFLLFGKGNEQKKLGRLQRCYSRMERLDSYVQNYRLDHPETEYEEALNQYFEKGWNRGPKLAEQVICYPTGRSTPKYTYSRQNSMWVCPFHGSAEEIRGRIESLRNSIVLRIPGPPLFTF
jgi:hypothetical protein